MKWLNYHHLYYFRCIAAEGGIAKAAKTLGLGQPTLSTQLKQLEESLGHPLFKREKRSLVLTETGKVALEYAKEIFQLGDEFLQVIDDQSMTNRKRVTVGCLDSVPKHLTLELVNFAQKTEDCVVSILEGAGDSLFRELQAHRVDLVISNYPPVALKEGKLYSKSMAIVPVTIYGASKFKGLRKGFPESLAGQPFVFPTLHSKLRADLDHYFALNHLSIKLVAETQDTSVQKLLGIHGIGLIPIPEFAAKELVSAEKLYKIGALKQVQEEFWLISGERKIQNPVAAAIMRKFKLK